MQYFSDYDLQQRVKDHFRNSLINNRLAHAYLFYGPEGTGKDAFALELAKTLNCVNNDKRPCYTCPSCEKVAHFNHPDVHFIFPIMKSMTPEKIREQQKIKSVNPFTFLENSGQHNILIDQIRELKNEAKYTPHEAKKKCYIISNADRMNKEAANSFLKILEEPPAQLIILLTTSNLNAIPVTIRSRCHVIYFPRLNNTEAQSVVSKFLKLDESLKELILLNENNLKKIFAALNQDFGEINQLIYEYIRSIAAEDVYKLTDIVDKMTAPRDRNYLLDLLNLLILWFKDVVYFLTLDSESAMINKSLKENITGFARLYGDSDFDSIIGAIDQAISDIQHNANGRIVLTVLGFRIRECLKKTELYNVT